MSPWSSEMWVAAEGKGVEGKEAATEEEEEEEGYDRGRRRKKVKEGENAEEAARAKKICCYTLKHPINWFNTHIICSYNFYPHKHFINLLLHT